MSDNPMIYLRKEALQEAADEAARTIFHGMFPAGIGRKDEPPKYRGFKKEMTQIIIREIEDRATF